MTNNDILRRLRFTFDLNDKNMMALFQEGGVTASRAQISDWLKQEDDEAYVRLTDNEFASFLNGFIVSRRGKKEGPPAVAERKINNNIIFRKIRIALDFKEDDVLRTLQLVQFNLSSSELSAFFRKPTHKHYRECQDQVLRNFLHGIQLKFKPETGESSTSDEA
jgi:uncharacterized protein YehS (DUF1456 family)